MNVYQWAVYAMLNLADDAAMLAFAVLLNFWKQSPLRAGFVLAGTGGMVLQYPWA